MPLFCAWPDGAAATRLGQTGPVDDGHAAGRYAADRYAAIVLAGGDGRRLGGRDKPALPVGGRPMLLRVLDAVAEAVPRVVVGPDRPDLPVDVIGVRENPPGGGPVAALAAGLAAVVTRTDRTDSADRIDRTDRADSADRTDCGLVAVLAADLPFLGVPDVEALRAAVGDQDGAVLVDADGRQQWLCGVYRVAALRGRLADLGPPAGQSVRRLVSGFRLVTVARRGAGAPPWYDCDTDEDYRQAQELA